MLFHQKPIAIVLQKVGVAPISTTVVNQLHLRIMIHDLTGKIAFKESIGVATIGDGDRFRIVVLV